MKFHFINVVWGDYYIDLFLNLVLSNQLSEGNLSSFRNLEGSRYKIFTAAKDEEKIRKSPIFTALSEILPTEISAIDEGYFEDNRDNKYAIFSDCHKRAIREAIDAGAILVFLSADVLWPDGTFANLIKLVEKGKRFVLVPGLRLQKETFLPQLQELFYHGNKTVATIPHRGLVKIALENLHPVARSYLWNSPHFTRRPYYLYWEVPEEGLLARCFTLHPLMVDPRGEWIPFSSTIDDDYIYKAIRDWNEVHVSGDSDDMFCCDMSDAVYSSGRKSPNRASRLKVAQWAFEYVNPIHRRFVQHKIRFHSNDLSSQWVKMEKESDRIVSDILSLLESSLILVLLRVRFFIMSVVYRWPRKVLSFLKWNVYFDIFPDSRSKA